MDARTFIQSIFADYYKKESDTIQAPKSIERREFGFILFKDGIMSRHKGFNDEAELRGFIARTVPLHAYYSTAYYGSPQEHMEEKGWLGADLFFDIDADHIPTKCDKEHDTWICRSCGTAGKGSAPEICGKCGNQRFEERTWPCEICLETAKYEVMKLVDILIRDFGFSLKDILCSFSGHRGYHAEIDNESVCNLNSLARKEIVDYVTGIGIDANLHLKRVDRKFFEGPHLDDPGWNGRIARGVYEFLLRGGKKDMQKIGIKGKTLDQLIDKKDIILKSWKDRGPWSLIGGMDEEKWKKIMEQGIENQSSKVDTVVTTDIHRLIRLPNTLHGKTGLLKTSFPTDDIERFDPLKSAIALKSGEVTILVDRSPKFRLGDESFGPYEDQKVELPMAAAVFLLCKDAARMVEQDV